MHDPANQLGSGQMHSEGIHPAVHPTSKDSNSNAAAETGFPLEHLLARGMLFLLLFGCLLVLWPFITTLLWAAVLAFSTWPVYRRLVERLRGRPTLAAALLSLSMIAAVVLPFGIVSLQLTDNVKDLKTATQRWLEAGPPAPPQWLQKVPVLGRSTSEHWKSLLADSSKLAGEVKRRLEPVAAWLLKAGLKLGSGLLHLALSVLVAFFLLRHGASIGAALMTAIERIAGQPGTRLLEVAGSTVRGVVYGILGTALVQAVLAAIGLLVAGVPGAPLLAMLVFFLSVVPLGPPLVLFPAAFWLFHQGAVGWGVFMLVWGVVVSTVDNFVKPWLISQGSDMPLILIFFGVLGGALAFGFIGVFIGPTLLAVGYRLVKEWLSGETTSTPIGHERREEAFEEVAI